MQPTPSLRHHSAVVGGPDSIQWPVSVLVTGTDIPQIKSFKESMWSERLSLGFREWQRVRRARLVKFHCIVKRTLTSTYLLMLASGPDCSMGPKAPQVASLPAGSCPFTSSCFSIMPHPFSSPNTSLSQYFLPSPAALLSSSHPSTTSKWEGHFGLDLGGAGDVLRGEWENHP